MTKIDKRKARKLYEAHEPFIMCASNLRPEHFGRRIGRMSFEQLIDEKFDAVVNAFEYYNCTNSETGRRVAFYIDD